MKAIIYLFGVLLIGIGILPVEARKKNKVLVKHSQPVGASGIAWYTTWETGVAEAKRSNRPIFFMAAATCKVPGAF